MKNNNGITLIVLAIMIVIIIASSGTIKLKIALRMAKTIP